MGKMLETLKLGEGQRAVLSVGKSVEAAPVQECVVDWEIGAEVPFIEVGAPGKKIELSPGLMKHPPQTVPQAPHLPVDIAPVVAVPKVVQLTETKPMTAALEPWPTAAPKPAGISTEIIAYHHPDHPASKEYLALIDAMRGNLQTEGAPVLLLCGLKPHVGTSTVLLNLAVSAAMKHQLRVAVVDLNRKHSGLAKRLGLAGSVGLMEVCAGTLALEQALVKTGIGSLHLVPAGRCQKQAWLTDESLTWLLAWLRERHDLILLDGPTLDDAADLGLQVPHADGIYLVLPQGESATLNKGIAQKVNHMGGRLCGLIHTHFEV